MWKEVILVFSILSCVICEELKDCSKYRIDTDLSPDDCDRTQNYFYVPNMYGNCIPGCLKYDKDPDATVLSCSPTSDPSNVPVCPPGYICNALKRCVVDENSCLKYYSKSYKDSRFKPTCLPDGSWAAKQCKGDRCFCFDSTGNRIYGNAFKVDANDMTCACSRKRAQMEKEGNLFFVSLHCDSMGNFEPLQCQDGNCWCVEPKTGEITAPNVPELLMTRLPCYNKTIIGEQYLRQCESHLFAQEKIRDEYEAHGTVKVNFADLKCIYDGNYGPYKLQSGVYYCVWKDNSNIGSYQVAAGDVQEEIDCNCAQDLKIFELAGKELLLTCKPNGNYNPLQRDGDEYYCVDSDGFRKNEPGVDPNVDCEAIK